MASRGSLVIAIGIVAVGATGALPASAAEKVVGKDVPQAVACYEAAEFNADLRTGIDACTEALLAEPLTLPNQAATYVNRGILEARNRDPNAAIGDYNTSLGINPNLADAYVNRGAAHVMLKQFNEAVSDLTKGLALGTDRPEVAYYDRAMAHEELGEIKAAYLDYKNALRVAPDYQPAIRELKRFKVVSKPAEDQP